VWDDRQEPSGTHGGIARHRKDTASLGSVIGALCRTRTELDGAGPGETAPSRQMRAPNTPQEYSTLERVERSAVQRKRRIH